MHRLKRGDFHHEQNMTKQRPNWGISALYSDRQLIRNKKMTKYFIPFDTAQPGVSWKLFLFKEDGTDSTLPLDIESTMIGRESYCDLRMTDKSVSRQHCVIQFRSVVINEIRRTVPYIFDLGSKWGTFLNDEQVPSRCFVELRHRDRLSFGRSEDSAVIMQQQ